MSDYLDEARRASLAGLIGNARWFGGKGRDFTISAVTRAGLLADFESEPAVVIDLVSIDYTDGGATGEAASETYQIPLAGYRHPQERLDHAHVGWFVDPELGEAHWYDALHDREAMSTWITAFDSAAPPPSQTDPEGLDGLDGPEGTVQRGCLTFRRLPGHELDVSAHSTLFTGEQSNSSVAFGEDSLLKVFRKITPGINPDVDVHRVLTRSGSDNVAALYGWLEWDLRGGSGDADLADHPAAGEEVTHLAMLQQFLRTATDGWDLALASVRNLFAEADLHAEEVGGDFAGEAGRLGAALADVHRLMGQEFESRILTEAEVRDLAGGMHRRLDEALLVVPELAVHVDRLRATYDAVAAAGTVAVQRIHGDLHLGQTLRTAGGWRIVDFEGEPAKALSDRLRLDSRWRDVAGMLRSFDYAPRAVAMTMARGGASAPGVGNDQQESFQRSYRSREWSDRNRSAFLDAYVGDGEALEAQERTLLDAYIADKAVYEAVYETRNRPTWVGIPLAALVEIGAHLDEHPTGVSGASRSDVVPGVHQGTTPEGGTE